MCIRDRSYTVCWLCVDAELAIGQWSLGVHGTCGLINPWHHLRKMSSWVGNPGRPPYVIPRGSAGLKKKKTREKWVILTGISVHGHLALYRLLLILKKSLWIIMFLILKNNNILLLTLFYKINDSRDNAVRVFWPVTMFFACRTAEYILGQSQNLSVILTGFCQNNLCFVWLFWLTVQTVFICLSK